MMGCIQTGLIRSFKIAGRLPFMILEKIRGTMEEDRSKKRRKILTD